MKKIFLYSITILVIFSSCTQKIYKDYNLFQKGVDSLKNFDYKEPLIQNNDALIIQINSATLSQDQAMVFNLGGAYSTQSYLVDLKGEINLPVLGKVKATGLTMEELRKDLVSKLNILIKDPIVVVKFLTFKVNVLGAVNHPGVQTFSTFNATIVDAIAQAGDFSDGAKRKNVFLVRDINGKRTVYELNFVDDASVFSSEAFQLQQNDFIYVPANDFKLKSVNQDQDIQKKMQMAQIVVSAITSISVLINTYFLLKRL